MIWYQYTGSLFRSAAHVHRKCLFVYVLLRLPGYRPNTSIPSQTALTDEVQFTYHSHIHF